MICGKRVTLIITNVYRWGEFEVTLTEEEKEKMGDAISRYITSVMKADKDEDSDKDESEIKSGALEAVKSAIQEIVAAWEQGGE